MPHSSGGSSSGGGSFSGSSSSHSSTPSPRLSSRPFPGGIGYIYYSVSGRPHLFYTDSDPSAGPKRSIFTYIILALVAVVPWVFLIYSGFHNPKKVDTNYDSSIVIDDRNEILSQEEETKLERKFQEFYTLSDITPSLITVQKSAWGRYFTLTDFAYERYLDLFKDERHWLLVYSSEENESKVSWEFVGMQGDDTDNVLYSYVADTFNRKVDQALREESNSVADSFLLGFEEIMPNLMEKSFYLELPMVLGVSAFSVLFVVIFVSKIFSSIHWKGMKNAVKAPDNPTLKKCGRCGCSYYAETVDVCPKCGKSVEFPRYAKVPDEQEQ